MAGLVYRTLMTMHALRSLSDGGQWASDCDHASGRALEGSSSSAAEGVPEVDQFLVVGRQGYVDGWSNCQDLWIGVSCDVLLAF